MSRRWGRKARARPVLLPSPPMQETTNGKKNGFLPIHRLSYDRIISDIVLVPVVGARSLTQSFAIPSIPASSMQSLRRPQGDKCWGVMSSASHLQSSTDAKKIVTRLPSALSIFHRTILLGRRERLSQLSWRCLTSTMSLYCRTISCLQLLLLAIRWAPLAH